MALWKRRQSEADAIYEKRLRVARAADQLRGLGPPTRPHHPNFESGPNPKWHREQLTEEVLEFCALLENRDLAQEVHEIEFEVDSSGRKESTSKSTPEHPGEVPERFGFVANLGDAVIDEGPPVRDQWAKLRRAARPSSNATWDRQFSSHTVWQLLESLAAAEAERDGYKQAILDLDANAAPMGEDRDGLIAGYYVTTAALHRALALVGDTTPRKARRTAGEESDA